MVAAGVYLIARAHGLFLTRKFCIWWALSGHYAGHGGFRRAGADRHQTRAGLFHHEPDWLHMFTAHGVQARGMRQFST